MKFRLPILIVSSGVNVRPGSPGGPPTKKNWKPRPAVGDDPADHGFPVSRLQDQQIVFDRVACH